MSNFRQLFLVLTLFLGAAYSLALGCSCNSSQPKQVSVPFSATFTNNQVREERTNKRLKGQSQHDQAILTIENNFIKYFASTYQEQQIMRQQILSNAKYIESLGKNCPGHLPYLADYLQYKYKIKPKPNYNDPWQQASYNYIISRPNLVKELLICQQYRIGKSRKFSAINHLEVGMVSQERANFLCSLVSQAKPLAQLKGKTIADIGGGIGILLTKLVAYVKPKSNKQLICIDIEPKLAELSHYMSKYDQAFQYIDYRLVRPNSTDIGLNEQEADLICIFDVHNIYDQFSPQNEEQRRQIGQQYLNKLKPTLKNGGSILIYDSAELMAPAQTVEQIAKNAGFIVKNLPINEANNHYLLQLTLP